MKDLLEYADSYSFQTDRGEKFFAQTEDHVGWRYVQLESNDETVVGYQTLALAQRMIKRYGRDGIKYRIVKFTLEVI